MRRHLLEYIHSHLYVQPQLPCVIGISRQGLDISIQCSRLGPSLLATPHWGFVGGAASATGDLACALKIIYMAHIGDEFAVAVKLPFCAGFKNP